MIRCNGGKALRRLEAVLKYGFESYQFHWWADLGNEDVTETLSQVRECLDSSGQSLPMSLALYGNPLKPDNEGVQTVESIRKLISVSPDFGSSYIGIFTGRLPGTPWDESLPVFRTLFEELCREAADHGVKLALENCPMDGDDQSGDWNLAHNSQHWERLFSALSSTAGDSLYLEWEPAHQILQGIDPLSSLTKWVDRVIHVHGKDARFEAGKGLETLPGNGTTSWDSIFRTLESAGYDGTVDIEGYHDQDWSGEKELTGQKKAMDYLRLCRSGRIEGPKWS